MRASCAFPDQADNYSDEIIQKRQRFVEQYTGKPLHQHQTVLFDAQSTQVNIENFTGIAQIHLASPGPLRINGEHPQGDFLIPLATSEEHWSLPITWGETVNLCGGVKCTVVQDVMPARSSLRL